MASAACFAVMIRDAVSGGGAASSGGVETIEHGDYGTAEDAHSVICHAVTLQLRELGERQRAAT